MWVLMVLQSDSLSRGWRWHPPPSPRWRWHFLYVNVSYLNPFRQSHLPARVDVPLILSAVVQVLHRQLISLLFEGRNGCKSRSKKKNNNKN